MRCVCFAGALMRAPARTRSRSRSVLACSASTRRVPTRSSFGAFRSRQGRLCEVVQSACVRSAYEWQLAAVLCWAFHDCPRFAGTALSVLSSCPPLPPRLAPRAAAVCAELTPGARTRVCVPR